MKKLQRFCSTYIYEKPDGSGKFVNKATIMKTKNNTNSWQETLQQLRWSPKHAEMSAKIALSKAVWLGIDPQEAIASIYAVDSRGIFQTYPHVPLETWHTLSEQFSEREQNPLLAFV